MHTEPRTQTLWRVAWMALVAYLFATLLGSAWSRAESRAAEPAPICNASVVHPIQVRVEALDPIERGRTVRVRVVAESRLPMGGTEVRMVSAGGTVPVSASRVALGRLAPGRPETREFAVRVPAAGQRFLLEFRVSGEGPAGRIARGAALNLLPDGPAVTPRVVESADGRAIAESPARRIP